MLRPECQRVQQITPGAIRMFELFLSDRQLTAGLSRDLTKRWMHISSSS